MSTLSAAGRYEYLRDIARDNASALAAAIERCVALGIGAFRMTSRLLPLTTHPASGYALADIDADGSIARAFAAAGDLARARDVRLSFHPDQFVVINSERPEVVSGSVRELNEQGALARLVGADVITLHGGGATGGLTAARDRLARG
ncbi:MAG: UV DNA damage repair endonuclease UvsE, partial [Gemmatimonadaceae bacterium]|nr:UV DNA damage repair endonuclease UvsE [Gemmatimonadaceae bacterium]